MDVIRPVVLLAGGGSGGTVLPGVAVAEALADDIDCVAAISDRPVDVRVLAGSGLPSIVLPARPPSIRPRGGIAFLLGWRRSVAAAGAELDRRGVRGVVALGGFVAPPVVAAARSRRIPVLAFNLDAVPGRAMQWIGARATCHCSAVPLAAELLAAPRRGPFATAPVVGRPIRRAARAPSPPDPAASRRALGLDPDRSTLLVTGASQGARSLGLVALAAATQAPAAFAGWQVIHLVGDHDPGPIRDAWAGAAVPAFVTEHLPHMGAAWGAASLALSRAGAGSVAEIAAGTVPSILLPYPWHRDRHQWRNAEPLVKLGGAEVMDDAIDPVANAPVVDRLIELMTDPDRLDRMRAALSRATGTDGASAVAAATRQMIGFESPDPRMGRNTQATAAGTETSGDEPR